MQKPYTIQDRTGTSYARDYPYTTQVIIKVISATDIVEKTTREINDIIDMVLGIIRNNPTFTKPTDSSDPKFVRSNIQTADITQNTRGKTKQVATIIIEALVTSYSKITIPDILTPVPIINVPVSREYVGYSSHQNTAGTLSGYAANTKSNTRYYEVEYDELLLIKLQQIRDSFEKKSYTITEMGVSKVFSAHLSAVNQSFGYDQLQIIILQFEVI